MYEAGHQKQEFKIIGRHILVYGDLLNKLPVHGMNVYEFKIIF